MRTNLSAILFLLVGAVFLTAPMTFLTLRPVINVFLVDFFILIAIAVFFVGVLKGVYRVNKILLIGIFLILFGYTLSSVNTVDHVAYFVGFVQYTLVFIFLLVTSSVISEEKDVVRLLSFYVLGVGISIIISYLILFQVISMPHLKEDIAGRFNGVWGNPNAMAKVMIELIMLSLALMVFYLKGFWIKALYTFLILIALFLILASASFGGILFLLMSFFVFILIFFYQSTLGSKFKMIAMFFGFSAIFLVLFTFVDINQFLPEIFIKRVLSAEDSSQAGSGAGKLAQIILGFKLFLENPIIGVGLENGKYVNLASLTHHGSYLSFHSFYSSVMVEGGLFSVLGFFLLFLVFLKNALEAKKIKYVFLIILSTFLINLIINNNIYTRYIWFPVSILAVSLLARPATYTKKENYHENITYHHRPK